MLYWERRRRRIVYQKSQPSSSATYAYKAHHFSNQEQPAFSEELSQPSNITPLPQYPLSSIVAGSVSFPPAIERSYDPLDLSSFAEQIYTPGPVEAPITPASFTDLFNRVKPPLPDEKAGQMFCLVPKSPTTSLYQPIIIPRLREGYRYRERVITIPRPPRSKGQQAMVHLAALCLCLFIFVGVLMIVSPVGDDERMLSMGQVFQPLLHLNVTKGNNIAPAWSRIATATAVTQDGYDPGITISNPYVNTASQPASSTSDVTYLNRFVVGQCTYWANMRYHQLTGHWVPWIGDAYEWASQALSYGWMVANRPNPHGYSIMVIQPQIQGAGSYGHVAVVEHTNPDDSVYTSNWNWKGDWHMTSYVTFTPQTGISFIWVP
jgi:surface antigen